MSFMMLRYFNSTFRVMRRILSACMFRQPHCSPAPVCLQRTTQFRVGVLRRTFQREEANFEAKHL